jgi:hypothetical protein
MKTPSSPSARGTSPTEVKGFKRYDGKRFAIVLPAFRDRPFRGTAHYQRDDSLGPILRIGVEGDVLGDPEILLVEREWNGLIAEDSRYGCDFSVLLLSSQD